MTGSQNPFGGQSSIRGDYMMRVGNFSCTLHTPPALEKRFDQSGQEIDQGLPPSAQRLAYLVDDLPTCPENWMRSSRDSTSYLVPVQNGRGLWLDFNGNAQHSHDVAVLISVQKLNPVIGRMVDGMVLEQYGSEDRRTSVGPHRFIAECPKHGVLFGHDRLCERCGYKWPGQNYLATTGTRPGELWLDGFRAEDGAIRQFVFTEETMRGVAAQIIGEERVFALGVSFFLSRNKKPAPVYQYRGYSDYGVQTLGGGFLGGGLESFGGGTRSYQPKGVAMGGGSTREVRNLEVGKGARVKQSVYPDPKDLSYWQESSSGTIYINYLSEDQAAEILRTSRPPQSDGFLDGLK